MYLRNDALMSAIRSFDVEIVQKLDNVFPSGIRVVVLLEVSKDSELCDVLRGISGENFDRDETTWSEIFREPDSPVRAMAEFMEDLVTIMRYIVDVNRMKPAFSIAIDRLYVHKLS